MSISPQSSYVLNRKYTDFDQMCEEVQAWNLDFLQLEKGRFSGEILQFGSGSVHIAEAIFGRGLLQRGAPPDGVRTIAIPAIPQIRIKWRGYEVSGTDLMIFPRGAELDSVSDDRFHVFTCSFPEELLASICDNSGIPQMDELQNGNDVVRISSESMSRIQNLLHQVAASVRSIVSANEDVHLRQAIAHNLPSLVLHGIFEGNDVSVARISGKRELILKNAVRLIDRFSDQPFTIRDLVDEVGVSQRTLEYAFNESLGVSPKTFVMSYRLNQVRRQLRSLRGQAVKIADIANRWGFWHMGQFAADYRKLFCELPSETLRDS